MKSLMKCAAWVGLAVGLAGVPALAQLKDNTEKQMTCENGDSGSAQTRHCDIREQTVPSVGSLLVDAGRNGGISVKGAARGDVLVRARVEAAGDTQSAADSMASQVTIDSSGGQVRAVGPESADNSWWSVSYEIFVPQNGDLTVKAHNGGITISDVRGTIKFETTNGGVRLRRVAGDVSGETVNGGLQVDLAGAVWDGRQMDVSTRNGGVTVTMPASYSAHVQAETRSGSIQSDFPLTLQGNLKPRQLDFTLGGGGPLIHVATQNGGVRLKQAETQ
ncbi:MAG TPA: DUF4097 family beta strand repeat-containing protein [Bryobacteraceae bacterium]|nr:DUF4097 family beta strand repeat-containing protein [Bryobacteraceae bacterium]